MKIFTKKSNKSHGHAPPHCPNCKLEVTEPTWQACPRCGQSLPHGCGCGGCGSCGH